MPFAKASPKQARLKLAIYGPPGSGKTFTTLLMAEGLAAARGGRVAYVDSERGTDFYAQKVPARAIHPEAFDFDALYTKSLADVLQSVEALDPKEYAVVVIDSMTHIWQSAIQAYEGRMTSIDSIPLQAWGSIKKPYKRLVDFLIGSKFDVFILGRQKNIFDTSTEGELRKVGVGMKAEGETEYEPHICIRMEAVKDSADSTNTTYLMRVEKDRSGVLSGRTFPNPSFATIECLLPLLGDEQAGAEDEDDRLEKDGELLEASKEKKASKEAKSAGLMADFNARAVAAVTLEELGAVGAEINKKKRSMTAEHTEALRLLYQYRSATLQKQITGEV